MWYKIACVAAASVGAIIGAYVGTRQNNKDLVEEVQRLEDEVAALKMVSDEVLYVMKRRIDRLEKGVDGAARSKSSDGSISSRGTAPTPTQAFDKVKQDLKAVRQQLNQAVEQTYGPSVDPEEDEPTPQPDMGYSGSVDQTTPDEYSLKSSSSDEWPPGTVLDFKYAVDDKRLLDSDDYEVTDAFPGLAEFLDANFVGDEDTWRAEVISPHLDSTLKIHVIPSKAFWPEELK